MILQTVDAACHLPRTETKESDERGPTESYIALPGTSGADLNPRWEEEIISLLLDELNKRGIKDMAQKRLEVRDEGLSKVLQTGGSSASGATCWENRL